MHEQAAAAAGPSQWTRERRSARLLLRAAQVKPHEVDRLACEWQDCGDGAVELVFDVHASGAVHERLSTAHARRATDRG